eukprot:TRINITY_DN7481_c0_g1_i1.p1 TRINITY_DN7481_c0_g1~~TRINITY_DN7481_c0_g1_i1.p1  ORF type:complete len:269 (-),score=51.11 TRINITY_DN7481_c0_g1_i1:130-888(-)
MGGYSLNVTATDEKSASISQVLTVWAYIAPQCSPISLEWTPARPISVNVANYCIASNALTTSFTEKEDNETIFESVSFSTNGSTITFTANDSCVIGRYLGVATVVDNLNGSTPISLQLTSKNNVTTISALKSSYSYLVVNTSNVNDTDYDGKVQVSGGKVKINLVQLVKLCGSDGPLDFSKIGADYSEFLSGSNNNGKIVGEINGVEMFISGMSNGASILRSWEFISSVIAEDRKTGNIANFTLSVIKPYEG